MQPSTKREMVSISDILDKITPDAWFPIKSICEYRLAASTRRRIEGIKEFKRRKKTGDYIKKFFEYYISYRDLEDLKKRVNANGRIDKTKNPKQVITKGTLSHKDKLYNRFLGVKC